MTDIVERLRSYHALNSPVQNMREAADEIERLRAAQAWPSHGVAVVRISAPDYGDVSPDLILEDFCANPKTDWHIVLLNDPMGSRSTEGET